MRCLALLLAAIALTLPGEAAARDYVSRPYPGLKLTRRVVTGQRIWVLETNLCQPGVRLRVTKYDEARANRDCRTTCPTPNASPQDCRTTCRSNGSPPRETPFVTVPKWASDRGTVVAAINGNFTCAGSCDQVRGIDGWVRGTTVGTTAPVDWGNRDHHYVAPFAFGPGRVDVWNDAEVQGNNRPPWATQIVSGHPTLVFDGRPQNNRAPSVDGRGDPLCNRNPRTAIGLSRDLRTLITAVVDGRDAPGALGMTCNELRDLMIEFGAYNASNIDGGGSSTLWLKSSARPNKVLNNPSDGAPRAVAVHLGIIASGTGAAPFCMTPDPECAANETFAGCNGAVLRECHHWKVDETDCAAKGKGCTAAEGAPRCVDARCVAGSGTRCDGGRIVSCVAQSNGDYAVTETVCGAGQVCVDAGGPRCVDANCAGRPDGAFCAAGAIGNCSGGSYSETSCGTRPCTSTPSGPRCVDPRCIGRENDSFCDEGGNVARCVDGAYETTACADGSSCVDEGEPVCIDDRCVGALPVSCLDPTTRATCVAGVYAEIPCPSGTSCTDEDGTPLCVDRRCIGRPGLFCSAEGLIASCAAGVYTETPCPDGLNCASGRCVEPGAEPDAGVDGPDVDAGEEPVESDGGEPSVGVMAEGGCGCRETSEAGALLLAGLGMLLKRRRARA